MQMPEFPRLKRLADSASAARDKALVPVKRLTDRASVASEKALAPVKRIASRASAAAERVLVPVFEAVAPLLEFIMEGNRALYAATATPVVIAAAMALPAHQRAQYLANEQASGRIKIALQIGAEPPIDLKQPGAEDEQKIQNAIKGASKKVTFHIAAADGTPLCKVTTNSGSIGRFTSIQSFSSFNVHKIIHEGEYARPKPRRTVRQLANKVCTDHMLAQVERYPLPPNKSASADFVITAGDAVAMGTIVGNVDKVRYT